MQPELHNEHQVTYFASAKLIELTSDSNISEILKSKISFAVTRLFSRTSGFSPNSEENLLASW